MEDMLEGLMAATPLSDRLSGDLYRGCSAEPVRISEIGTTAYADDISVILANIDAALRATDKLECISHQN